jgi:hypothetical protein
LCSSYLIADYGGQPEVNAQDKRNNYNDYDQERSGVDLFWGARFDGVQKKPLAM